MAAACRDIAGESSASRLESPLAEEVFQVVKEARTLLRRVEELPRRIDKPSHRLNRDELHSAAQPSPLLMRREADAPHEERVLEKTWQLRDRIRSQQRIIHGLRKRTHRVSGGSEAQVVVGGGAQAGEHERS